MLNGSGSCRNELELHSHRANTGRVLAREMKTYRLGLGGEDRVICASKHRPRSALFDRVTNVTFFYAEREYFVH